MTVMPASASDSSKQVFIAVTTKISLAPWLVSRFHHAPAGCIPSQLYFLTNTERSIPHIIGQLTSINPLTISQLLGYIYIYISSTRKILIKNFFYMARTIAQTTVSFHRPSLDRAKSSNSLHGQGRRPDDSVLPPSFCRQGYIKKLTSMTQHSNT